MTTLHRDEILSASDITPAPTLTSLSPPSPEVDVTSRTQHLSALTEEVRKALMAGYFNPTDDAGTALQPEHKILPGRVLTIGGGQNRSYTVLAIDEEGRIYARLNDSKQVRVGALGYDRLFRDEVICNGRSVVDGATKMLALKIGAALHEVYERFDLFAGGKLLNFGTKTFYAVGTDELGRLKVQKSDGKGNTWLTLDSILTGEVTLSADPLVPDGLKLSVPKKHFEFESSVSRLDTSNAIHPAASSAPEASTHSSRSASEVRSTVEPRHPLVPLPTSVLIDGRSFASLESLPTIAGEAEGGYRVLDAHGEEVRVVWAFSGAKTKNPHIDQIEVFALYREDKVAFNAIVHARGHQYFAVFEEAYANDEKTQSVLKILITTFNGEFLEVDYSPISRTFEGINDNGLTYPLDSLSGKILSDAPFTRIGNFRGQLFGLDPVGRRIEISAPASSKGVTIEKIVSGH